MDVSKEIKKEQWKILPGHMNLEPEVGDLYVPWTLRERYRDILLGDVAPVIEVTGVEEEENGKRGISIALKYVRMV